MPFPGKPALLVVAFAAAVAMVSGAAILDYRDSVAEEVPPVPEPCLGQGTADAALTQCNEARNAELEDRVIRARELSDAYERRLVPYSLAVLAIGIVYLLLRLRTLPPDARRTAFADLGVTGVAWLVAVLGLAIVQSESAESPFGPSIEAPLAVGGVFLLIAAVGSLMTRSGPAGGGTRQPIPRPSLVVKIGAGFAGAAILLSSVAAGSRNGCTEPRPEWLDTGFNIAFILAAGAIVCGVVALFQRRWVASLLLIGGAPTWVILAALGAACLN